MTPAQASAHASSGTLGTALLAEPIAPMELVTLELSNALTLHTELVVLRMRPLTKRELGR